jgi:hypothetical protein
VDRRQCAKRTFPVDWNRTFLKKKGKEKEGNKNLLTYFGEK